MNLSAHFTLQEMTASETAKRLHIVNTPNDIEIAHLTFLCKELLEPLRVFLRQPIIVTSGFRSAALNKAVGGAKNSYHLQGMAADIAISGPLMAQHCNDFLQKLMSVDQIIYEQKGRARWLHIGWSYAPRHQFIKIIK